MPQAPDHLWPWSECILNTHTHTRAMDTGFMCTPLKHVSNLSALRFRRCPSCSYSAFNLFIEYRPSILLSKQEGVCGWSVNQFVYGFTRRHKEKIKACVLLSPAPYHTRHCDAVNSKVFRMSECCKNRHVTTRKASACLAGLYGQAVSTFTLQHSALQRQ